MSIAAGGCTQSAQARESHPNMLKANKTYWKYAVQAGSARHLLDVRVRRAKSWLEARRAGSRFTEGWKLTRGRLKIDWERLEIDRKWLHVDWNRAKNLLEVGWISPLPVKIPAQLKVAWMWAERWLEVGSRWLEVGWKRAGSRLEVHSKKIMPFLGGPIPVFAVKVKRDKSVIRLLSRWTSEQPYQWRDLVDSSQYKWLLTDLSFEITKSRSFSVLPPYLKQEWDYLKQELVFTVGWKRARKGLEEGWKWAGI